jgi:signal transduction histidine kinase
MGLSHVETEETLERLRLAIDELRASRQRIALADDADRRRLERELHDGTQAELVALAVNLQLARELVAGDPEAAIDLLDGMSRDLQRALHGAAHLAQRIYPPLLESGGLSASLRAAATATGVVAEIKAAVVELPPETAGAIYFCCRDALVSTTRDARPARIVVDATEDAVSFELGGSAAAIPDDVLVRIRDRVEALGGRLTIVSRPGERIVRGSLPLDR